jgi:hypothetical protein
MLKYFKDIWDILRTLGIFYEHLVHFMLILYIFSGFGIMYQEKSGNPGLECRTNQDPILRLRFTTPRVA